MVLGDDLPGLLLCLPSPKQDSRYSCVSHPLRTSGHIWQSFSPTTDRHGFAASWDLAVELRLEDRRGFPLPVGSFLRISSPSSPLSRSTSWCSASPWPVAVVRALTALSFLSRAAAMKHCFYNETVGFFYNNSRKELTTYWRTKDVLVVALGLTVSVIVLLTNLLVITAIIINRRFHYPIYYLLGNLAAADLFAGIAYMFLMFHTGPRTAELSLKTWFIRQSLLDTSLTASVVNLLAIAVERHQTVFTMQLHSKMSNQRVMILIFCIWVTALLLGLIPSYGWHCLCALEKCSSMAPLYSRSYLTFWAISNLVIFLIMVVVYTHIFIYVKRKMTRMSKHTNFHPRYKETMISLVKTVTIILSKSPPLGPGWGLGTAGRAGKHRAGL